MVVYDDEFHVRLSQISERRLIPLTRTSIPDLSRADALAKINVFVEAVNYYAVSGPTLRAIFGADNAKPLDTDLPKALQNMVRARFL